MYGIILDLPEGIVKDVCLLAQQMPSDTKKAKANPVFKFLSDLRDAIGTAASFQQMRRRDLVAGRATTPAGTRRTCDGK